MALATKNRRNFDIMYQWIEMFVSTLRVNSCAWYLNCLPNKGITSLSKFLRIFLRQQYTGETTVEYLDKFPEGFLHASLPQIDYHEEDPKLPHLIKIENDRYWVLPPRDQNEEEIHDDPIDDVHEEPFIEDPPHVTLTENIDDWECFHDYFSDYDHICTPNLPQDETITEAYNETYDQISNEHNDNSLEGLLPCDLFSKEDDYDLEEDKYNQEHDTSDEESLISNMDGDEDYETLFENPNL